MHSGFKTVWLLALVNAIAMCAFPLLVLIGSIIGTKLAPSEQWATLPVALVVIGTASGVIPASRCMARWGRQKTFLLFIGLGISACLMAGEALALASFTLFCLCTWLLGVTNAALLQIRFAAMESLPAEQGPTAASIIMCAGIVSAFAGPELALLGRELSSVEYRGSFWLAAALFAIGAVLLLAYRPVTLQQSNEPHNARPLAQMLQNPTLLLAIGSGAIGFVVMSFIMTATPISMHLHMGHSLEDTKWVIQSHIAAMYMPSLLAAWLFRMLGIKRLMLAGLACFATTIVVGLLDASVMGYWGQLVMLGIGWNFLFLSGTSLLPSTYRDGEQYRAQALNDFVVFSIQAVAALSAGWAITSMSWHNLLLLCLLPMALFAALLVRHGKSL